MPYTLFLMITPLDEASALENEANHVYERLITCGIKGNLKYPDTYSMGFPFDREIDETQFLVPNMYEKDVLIYHQDANDMTGQYYY